MPVTLAERLREKLDTSGGPDTCWPHRAPVRRGYASIHYGRGKYVGAHQAAWMLANGPLPQGMCVLHKCDNRACCNPAHLFLGTKAENNRDRARKGRSFHPNGELHGCAKLTADDVTEIRALRGQVPQLRLATRFGVSVSNICTIQRGNSWTHLQAA